jgi:hypothetical protein
MTPLREALILPCLFLTVVLLGGLRIGTSVRLLPPPLVSVVLAMLLLGSLVRAHVVRPDRLMNQARRPLENLSGLLVLLTLFAASAQVLNMVTPDSGLLHLLVSVFFFVQLLTTLAAARDRIAMLRSLAVLLGCVFVLRFIALESLYSPGRGLLKRVMTTLLEGVTLGSLEYEPTGTATGYVAFAALTLYLIGLVLCSDTTQHDQPGLVRQTPSEQALAPLLLMVAVGAVVAGGCTGANQRPTGSGTRDAFVDSAVRERSLAAARVWQPPAVPVSSADLGENPGGPAALRATDTVSCRFVPELVNGTTPKFRCELEGGEIVKVKYGRRNPEVFAEVAATRLLAALGFAADRMYLVARVTCAGCPAFPFQALRCHAVTGLRSGCLMGPLNSRDSAEFEPAVVERRLPGRAIESHEGQGWAWFELDRVDSDQGGASRAEIDAMRLIAVLLAHWDNKSENQRLICPPEADRPDGSCARPIGLIQDLGATFGPVKLDLPNWRRVPVWKDARSCTVSMEHLPFNGATFPETTISEDGRLLLLGVLEQVSEAQLRTLFVSAGITTFDGVSGDGRNPEAWVQAFREKVRQVREAGPCPSSASPLS